MAQEEEIQSSPHHHHHQWVAGRPGVWKTKGSGEKWADSIYYYYHYCSWRHAKSRQFPSLVSECGCQSTSGVKTTCSELSTALCFELEALRLWPGFLGHDVQARERPRAKHPTQLASWIPASPGHQQAGAGFTAQVGSALSFNTGGQAWLLTSSSCSKAARNSFNSQFCLLK